MSRATSITAICSMNPAPWVLCFAPTASASATPYIDCNGHIGPLAVTGVEFLGDAFTTAVKMAADRSCVKISAFVPGTCEGALSLAVRQGMHITFPMLLMASPGYGTWTQYLPRNPGLM